VIAVQGDPDLLQMVSGLRPAGGFAGLLDGGQQNGDQHRDDRDHHQQLNQRKPLPGTRHKHEEYSRKKASAPEKKPAEEIPKAENVRTHQRPLPRG
jgi:hypothetical protein